MVKAALPKTRERILWRQVEEILGGHPQALEDFKGLVVWYRQASGRYSSSGSMASGIDQLRELASAADAMAQALNLGPEAREWLFGPEDDTFRAGFLFDGGWLPGADDFKKLAGSCRAIASEYSSVGKHWTEGKPNFFHVTHGNPKRQIVFGCDGVLKRAGKGEGLKDLVLIAVELATEKKPSSRFEEREIQRRNKAHTPLMR
jgi:hypothetical protein